MSGIKAARRALGRAARAHGGDRLSPPVLRARNTLAVALYRAGRLTAADLQISECVRGCQAIWGPEHPDTLVAEGNLAAVRLAEGDPAAIAVALDLLEQAARTRSRVFGPEHRLTLDVLHALGIAYRAAGDSAAARRVLTECLWAPSIPTPSAPPPSSWIPRTRTSTGRVLTFSAPPSSGGARGHEPGRGVLPASVTD